jgi:hypothetical protein
LRNIVTSCVIFLAGFMTTAGCGGDSSTGGSGGGTGGATSSTGAGGSCEAPLVACGAACMDTRVDPANCGACGHDCQGGECKESTCKPVTLAEGLASAGDIVVDGNGIYFSSGALFEMPHDGGAPESIAGSGGTLALGGNRIYVSSMGVGLFSVPSGGGQAATVSLAAGQAIAADAANVYWLEDVAMDTLELFRSAHGSGAPVGMTTFTNSSVFDVSAMASDGEKIFIAFTSILNSGVSPGLYEVPINGGPTLPRVQGKVYRVAVSGSNVYAATDDSILEGPVTAGQFIKIASVAQGVTGLAADAEGVYWTEYTGSVMKLVEGDTTPIPIAQHGKPLWDITTDAKSIYWAVPQTPGSMDAKIMKVAK